MVSSFVLAVICAVWTLTALLAVFDHSFELLQALFVVVESGLLFEIDAEQGRQKWILVVQQSARISVFTGVFEEPIKLLC